MDAAQVDEWLHKVPARQATIPTVLASAIAGLFVLHQVLAYLDYAILSPFEIAWNALVYLTPGQLVLSREKRDELNKKGTSWSQRHAAKSEVMRSMLGLGGKSLMSQLPAGGGIARKMSLGVGKVQTDAPPGLGNWDNSCYQNSMLQGLSAVESLKPYLAAFSASEALPSNSTSGSLQETLGKLNDATNNGRHIWTPAKLKSMSSWQQQDAQEYYSKIVDELEKEASKALGAAEQKPGLESVQEEREKEKVVGTAKTGLTNPLEGLLAQRVACTRCGFSEGLSMIPFNCLTVPLGSGYEYDLSDCLTDYTGIEDISDVECAQCTLFKAQSDLKRMMPKPADENQEPAVEDAKVLQLPPELRLQITQRLQAIEKALDEDDFSDKTLKESCQISKKARVSSTKTRQAVIGRAPQGLVIHVNRSVFDEMTGAQRKNYAAVRYPHILDLGKWMMAGQAPRDKDKGDAEPLASKAVANASRSMLSDSADADSCLYRLKAVVTHYGRHENGHYIAYRQHPRASSAASEAKGAEGGELVDSTGVDKMPWWRLSDEDVSSVSEEDVARQGGVFMLFYERDASLSLPPPKAATAPAAEEQQSAPSSTEPPAEIASAASLEKPSLTEEAEDEPAPLVSLAEPDEPAAVNPSESSTGATTEDESEADVDEQQPQEAAKPIPIPAAQPRMRTARVDSVGEPGFGSPHRAVAAS